jgi:hypothetical protein
MEPTAIYATREGNLTGETVEMSVDAASMAHVMSILTDLYSDPKLAVVREYSTNAHDSHIAAGVTKPIEVSLPNAMSPFFKVRDYGVGLSVDDIRNVYSKYGASTKRATNEQVGMLGLGCKSALTYTQQFTVRSVKDGQLALVAISRTETGSGVMEIVHTSATDELNGVEISIPINRGDDFSTVAKDFFRFWKSGTVLVDGEEPVRFSGLDLGNEITLVKGMDRDYVVMGNVAYRVGTENALYNRYSSYRSFGIVAQVPIGSVNFTPSREDLHYTKHTITTLDAVRTMVEKNLLATVQADVDTKETHFAARLSADEWRQMLGVRLEGMTYKNELIPSNLNIDITKYRPDGSRNSVNSYRGVNFNELTRCILIHGYTEKGISTHHKAKMRLWAAQEGLGSRTFIVTESAIEQKWFTNENAVDWPTVFATKKPRIPREDSQETFHVISRANRYGGYTADLPKDKPIVIYTTGEPLMSDYITQIINLGDDEAIALRLPKNRWDKFRRENANAVLVGDYLDKLMKIAYDALTVNEKLSMSLDYHDKSLLRRLDAKRLDDPTLVRYTEIVHNGETDSAAIKQYNNLRTICIRLGRFVWNVAEDTEIMHDKYPLLGSVTNGFKAVEHFYLYANTVYANEGNNA